MNMKWGFAMLLSGFFLPGFSQPLLTLKEALFIGLENNLEVKMVKNEVLLARESNSFGMAGFMPSVNLSAGRTYQWNDISQKFSSGLEVNRSGVSTNTSNAGLSVNWVLFDGGKMFITKKKLEEQETMADLRLKNQILNLSDSIAAAYYQLVLARLDMDIIQTNIDRTEERRKLAEAQFTLGIRSKSDLLQAQIDLNVLHNQWENLKMQLAIRKGAFNQMLGRDPEIDFEVQADVSLTQKQDYSNLKTRVMNDNLQIKLQQKTREIAQLGVKEVKSRALPQINLNTGYNFGRTNSAAGFALYNQSFGPNVGLSVSVPLFSGISVKKLVTLANIDLEAKNLQLKLMESRLSLQLWKAINNLDMQLETMRIENENILLAKENLAIAKGRFELAQATSLEYKDAQVQLSNAESRLLQAKFNAKIAEMTIRRLEGKMVLEWHY